MEGQRKVSQVEAETWCTENGDMPHFSVSAKDGDGVEQAFNTLAKKAKRILDEWYLHYNPRRHLIIQCHMSRWSNQRLSAVNRNQQQPVEDRTYLSDVNSDDNGEQPCQC
jgi:hypothetical protein